MCNTAFERGAVDPAAARRVQQHFDRVRRLLGRALANARRDGRLPGDPDSHVIVRATRDHPRPGEVVKVKVDTAHLHLFDGATGLRVGE